MGNHKRGFDIEFLDKWAKKEDGYPFPRRDPRVYATEYIANCYVAAKRLLRLKES